MKGWRFVYLQDVVSPGRAAGGDERLQEPAAPLGQGLRPDLPEAPAPGPGLARCPSTSRLESAFHLTANFAYPLMVLLSLLMFPAMVIRYNMGLYEMLIVDVPLFMGATLQRLLASTS